MDSRTSTFAQPHHHAAVDSESLSLTTRMSSIRRKPQFTYQSPSNADFRPKSPMVPTTLSQQLSSSALKSGPSNCVAAAIENGDIKAVQKRRKYPMGPPLPLYHPLGRLALSLPPLDPSTLGLPNHIRIHDAVRRSSARTRRPAAKLRDAEDEVLIPVATVSAIAPDGKDKISPRKRRAGGAGAGSKRKRKEVDDGDATYPAKRTRNPRAAGSLAAEDESLPPESVVISPEVAPPEPVAIEMQEDKKPERRSTRSRGALKRRDSSASDSASVSASVDAGGSAPVGTSKAKGGDLDKKSDSEDGRASGDGKVEEKEDGEVSEEGRTNSTNS